MKARKIQIELADAKVLWAAEAPEFSHLLNAVSSLLPYLEPFLNRTVRACMDALPAEHEDLRQDCRFFIAQESEHYRNHERFNRALRAGGYPDLGRREAKLKADYDFYWKHKSRSYCLRYAEGFETTTPILARVLATYLMEMRQLDLDDPTVLLFRWHLCEEYEHRHVCFQLHDVLHPSYWLRMWGLCYAGRHLLSYVIRTAMYLIREDRKAGRIPDVWNSRLRFSRILARIGLYAIPHLARVASPGYDPVDLPPPPDYETTLQEAEQRWGGDLTDTQRQTSLNA